MSGKNEDNLRVTSKHTKNLLVDPDLEETRDQNFVCISFVAPKDMIEQKRIYSMNKFMCNDINNEIAMVGRQLGMYVSRELKNKFDEEYANIESLENKETASIYRNILDSIRKRLNITEQDLEKKCIREYTNDPEILTDKYNSYMTEHGLEIDREFEQISGNRTSTMGIKVRAVTDTRMECERLAKYFSEEVENYVDTFVAPTKVWLTMNPDPERVDQHHQIKELDTLIKTNKLERAYQNKEFQNRIFSDKTDYDFPADKKPIDYTTSTSLKLHEAMEKKRQGKTTGSESHKRRRHRGKKRTEQKQDEKVIEQKQETQETQDSENKDE